jgi:hypothetical protein
VPEGSEKGQSLIYAYRSLAINTNTPGLKKLSTALINDPDSNSKSSQSPIFLLPKISGVMQSTT